MSEQAKQVGHDEARAALIRFENYFWKKDADHPRVSIPARRDYDDDLMLHAYIKQQREQAAELSRLRAEKAELVARLTETLAVFDEDAEKGRIYVECHGDVLTRAHTTLSKMQTETAPADTEQERQ